MYKAEFDRYLQKGDISNSFVLFGESSFLIERYTKILTKSDDASVLTYYYDEYDFKGAKAHLSQASLFGGKNILIIKSEKKVPKKELDELIEYCQKNPDNLFVYAYYGTDYKTYAKAFVKKNTMAVRFFNPKQHEAIQIVAQTAKEKNLKIDNYTIAHLLNIHNSDVALACNEIEKLSVYDKEITTKEVEELVSGLAEVNMEDLIKQILLKKEFTHDLNNILEHGEDEIRVLTMLSSYVTQLYMFNIYIRVNGAPNALEILGYPAPKFVIDEKASISLKFKPNTYYKLHELLLDSELKMKNANVDKRAVLLSTLIRVQQLI